jgi:hypothetical protein
VDADGIRRAMDFGMQDYNSLETAGVSLWGLAQNSQRWEVYRYNNFVHNTLTVNGQLQNVAGKAVIGSWSSDPSLMNAITDMTEVYRPSLKKAVRGIAIVDGKYVAVRDEIETNDSAAIIRWTMLTPADVKVNQGGSATLTKDGKKLTLKVLAPQNVSVTTWSTVPPHSYDAKNPGTVLTGFEARIPANSKVSLLVLLIPEGVTENQSISRKTLGTWPKTH